MNITDFVWLDQYVEKLEEKHGVYPNEVVEVFDGRVAVKRVTRGYIRGEDVYRVLGQTYGGRYLAVFFIRKNGNQALIISARDMQPKERRAYERK